MYHKKPSTHLDDEKEDGFFGSYTLGLEPSKIPPCGVARRWERVRRPQRRRQPPWRRGVRRRKTWLSHCERRRRRRRRMGVGGETTCELDDGEAWEVDQIYICAAGSSWEARGVESYGLTKIPTRVDGPVRASIGCTGHVSITPRARRLGLSWHRCSGSCWWLPSLSPPISSINYLTFTSVQRHMLDGIRQMRRSCCMARQLVQRHAFDVYEICGQPLTAARDDLCTNSPRLTAGSTCLNSGRAIALCR